MPLSRHSVGTYPENEVTCNLSGNIRPQSSQLAEPLWTDPDIKSAFSARELISTSNKWIHGRNGRTLSQTPCKPGKSHHHHHHHQHQHISTLREHAPTCFPLCTCDTVRNGSGCACHSPGWLPSPSGCHWPWWDLSYVHWWWEDMSGPALILLTPAWPSLSIGLLPPVYYGLISFVINVIVCLWLSFDILLFCSY